MEQENRLCDKIFFGVVIAFIFSCAMYAMAQSTQEKPRYIWVELNQKISVECKKYRYEARQQLCAKRMAKEFYARGN